MEEFAISFTGAVISGLYGADRFVVEYAADGDGVHAGFFDNIDDVICFSGSAMSDDGNANGGRYFLAQFEVEAFTGAFTIDGGGEYFTGA